MNKRLREQLQDFARLSGGFRATRVILTANNFAVFEQLKTPKSAAVLSRKLGTDLRATEILLDALVALGLLRKTSASYRNTEPARLFLVKDSPWYQGDMLRHMDALWKSWSGLDEVLRTGKPNRSGGRDYDSFIRAMHNNAVFRVKSVVDAIDLHGVKRALDLGGGPGTYSMELAKHGIAVTLFDLPEAIDIAKGIIRKQKIKNISYQGGDFHSDDIGAGYDLILISQILHSLSPDECIGLIQKAREALNPGGTIAVHEFLLEKDRTHPVPGALFSINMLVNTDGGRSYSWQEVKSWFAQAGLKGVKKTVLGETVVLTGTV